MLGECDTFTRGNVKRRGDNVSARRRTAMYSANSLTCRSSNPKNINVLPAIITINWLRMGRLMIPPSKNMMNINQGKQHQGKRKKQTKSNVNVIPNSIQQHSTCKLFSQRHVRLLANCITKESFVATIYHSTPYEIRDSRSERVMRDRYMYLHACPVCGFSSVHC